MSRPNALKAMDTIWFRFTHEADAGKYGSDWYEHSEADLLRKPARELIALEEAMGIPVLRAINAFRRQEALGDLAVSWLGVHLADPARAGDFDEFNPITNLIEWTGVEPERLGKGEKALSGEDPIS